MKKEEFGISININDDKGISHINVLWLIYRALAENLDICTLDDKTFYRRDTEEDK